MFFEVYISKKFLNKSWQLLIIGGGFIGTHTCLRLLKSKHELVILDNFSNSSPLALNRVCEIA